jgi:hypothetical protein
MHPCCPACAPGAIVGRCFYIALFAAVQAFQWAVVMLPLHKAGFIPSFYVVASGWSLFSLLWFWCYVETCWRDPGSVLSELRRMGLATSSGGLAPLPDELAALPRCQKCDLPKPARTHHCSECDRCYFRFDHHCPVVGNCIALRNMKAFMLLLFYSCVLIMFSAIVHLTASLTIEDTDTTFPIAGLVGGILVSFVLGTFAASYIPNVCINRTTIERIAGLDAQTYNAGPSANMRQIFGESCFLWILPTPPPVNGFVWSRAAILSPAVPGTIEIP